MSTTFLVPTGTIIKEYLEENNISNKELSHKTGLSEKHISNVLNNKCKLTEEFALKLEKVMPKIDADYWVNYESKYKLAVAREEEMFSISTLDLTSISKRFLLNDVFKELGLSREQKAIEMLKLLKISDFDQFDNLFFNTNIKFFEDGGEKEAIAIWLSLCENEIDIQNDELDDIPFKKHELVKNLSSLKMISNNLNTDESLIECKQVLNKMGIYLVDCEAVKNCKIRGALTTYRGKPAIYISRRYKRHSIIWFTIFHELSHLILHYNKKEALISGEKATEKEIAANYYARNLLICDKEYQEFIDNIIITNSSIIDFAKSQNIAPCFIVDFLHHDKIVDYYKFRKL